MTDSRYLYVFYKRGPGRKCCAWALYHVIERETGEIVGLHIVPPVPHVHKRFD